MVRRPIAVTAIPATAMGKHPALADWPEMDLQGAPDFTARI